MRDTEQDYTYFCGIFDLFLLTNKQLQEHYCYHFGLTPYIKTLEDRKEILYQLFLKLKKN